MSLSDLLFLSRSTKCSPAFELESDSHVNHDECDAAADCRVENHEQVLLTDCGHIDDSLRAIVVPQGLVNLYTYQQEAIMGRAEMQN